MTQQTWRTLVHYFSPNTSTINHENQLQNPMRALWKAIIAIKYRSFLRRNYLAKNEMSKNSSIGVEHWASWSVVAPSFSALRLISIAAWLCKPPEVVRLSDIHALYKSQNGKNSRQGTLKCALSIENSAPRCLVFEVGCRISAGREIWMGLHKGELFLNTEVQLIVHPSPFKADLTLWPSLMGFRWKC